MGLDIEFHFDDGRIHKVHMCYSNFSNKVMSIQDMVKWDLQTMMEVIQGISLIFLLIV